MTPLPLASPWQALYEALHARRRRRHIDRAQRLPRPVVSIGNLHWGGGGKTPLTCALATWLRERGNRPAILSRGYGRRDRSPVIVSRGQGPLVGVERAGDEPWEMADRLAEVAVVVARERFDAGRLALEVLEPTPDVFLLDDGFSHVRLHRDLDLLAFPAEDPLGGQRLAPSGRLREPLAAARHADAVVLTGLGSIEPRTATDPRTGQQLAERLRAVGFAGPGFNSELRAHVTPIGPGYAAVLAAQPKVLLVSGVARPDTVAATAREIGIEVAEHLRFRDHHPYPAASLERIRSVFETLHEAGAVDAVLVTAKDRVKLAGRLDLPLMELVAHAHLEHTFITWLEQSLSAVGLPRSRARGVSS